jgi:phage terminase large subunit
MIKLGYCDNDADALRYQGQQFDVIFIDEATQFPEMWFTWISGACRGVNAFPKRVYLTCNPGGIGHEWVKRLFIDKIYTEDEDPADYTFIQAKATDNYALKEADPGYLKWLDGLPEGLREAWRDGSWDIFAGQYFSEFSKPIHVIEPFVIPAHWKRYVSMDYGFGDMCAVLWEAIDEQGKVYVYREFCEKNVLPSAAAQRIKELSVNEKVIDFIAPPDLFAKMKDGGRSVAEQFGENGIYLTQASNRRADGWIAIKEQIKLIDTPDGGKTANLKIFTNCLNLITSLPKLQYDTDKLDGDIIAEHKYTHSPDALRYFCISHTSFAKPLPGEKPVYAFTFTMPAEEQPIDYGETIKAM